MSEAGAFTCDVTTEEPGGVCVLALAGWLDPFGSDQLAETAERLRQAGHRRFVIDLAGVDFISSVGLQSLIGLQMRVKPDGRVCVCNTNPNVHKVFEVTKMERVITLCPDRPAALAAARA